MSSFAALLHFFSFCVPAVGVAALLSPALVRWRGGASRRAGARLKSLLIGWAALSALGVLVLLAGWWWTGRDGRMLSYGALVAVLGTAVALWRSR